MSVAELILSRSHVIDLSIIAQLHENESVTVSELIHNLGKTREMIVNRLEVLEAYSVVRFGGDRVFRGLNFGIHYRALISNSPIVLPINAKDLTRSPRQKLIIYALNQLKFASRYEILEFLQDLGDHIGDHQTVYQALTALQKKGVVGVVEGTYPKAYKLNFNVIVTETPEELFSQCRKEHDLRKRKQCSNRSIRSHVHQ